MQIIRQSSISIIKIVYDEKTSKDECIPIFTTL